MNDDLVQPNRGFGEHPHRDVEVRALFCSIPCTLLLMAVTQFA